MTLRLVHPAPPKEPKKLRRPPPMFSPDESSRIRAALRHARALFGTWGALGAAMYLNPKHVQAASTSRKPIAASLAVRLAKALGKPLETLCAPPADAGTCPHCGARRVP